LQLSDRVLGIARSSIELQVSVKQDVDVVLIARSFFCDLRESDDTVSVILVGGDNLKGTA
jgi:hypothetical protein